LDYSLYDSFNHIPFTRTEPDGIMLRLVLYIDDGLYFCASEGALDRFKKELPARFNVDFLGTAH
jgi:hypothetical protein